MARRGARIQGRGGRIRCDWSTAALLRDNVMHWMEDGAPSGRYPTIHQLAECAASENAPAIDAVSLARELNEVLPELRGVRGADVAVGVRTRARMTRQRRLPAVRGTELARLIGWDPPILVADDISLGACFEPLLRLCLRVAAPAA